MAGAAVAARLVIEQGLILGGAEAGNHPEKGHHRPHLVVAVRRRPRGHARELHAVLHDGEQLLGIELVDDVGQRGRGRRHRATAGAGEAAPRIRSRMLRTCERIRRVRAGRQNVSDQGAKHSRGACHGEHLQRRAGAFWRHERACRIRSQILSPARGRRGPSGAPAPRVPRTWRHRRPAWQSRARRCR